jgi:D-alanyl-D-alanine carboxypeptidase/D-alanyl-D-alanine-endopeptidase (penicillin-binding protein 4)
MQNKMSWNIHHTETMRENLPMQRKIGLPITSIARLAIVPLLLFFGIFLPGRVTATGAISLPVLSTLLDHGGYVVRKGGQEILTHNDQQLLVPASTWKIATALMAFARLGEGYRFEIHLFLIDGDLYIKGFGDPFLVSEEAEKIVVALAGQGIVQLRDIVVDDSFFQLNRVKAHGAVNSLEPYDAANSALAVNFNTINVEVATDGAVQSAERQTPLLPVMKAMGAQLPPGRHRVNLSQDSARVGRYVGELFHAFFVQKGVQVTGEIRSGQVPEGAQSTYRHVSPTSLNEIVRDMMHYSNNFIANQLFLTCGAKAYGAPATWAKGEKALTAFLLDSGLSGGDFQVKEGSGLSRENRITPAALLHLLDAFSPHANLLPLSHGRLIKSGTLSGVYAYAGYFVNGPTHDPFVLILNQPKNTRDQLLENLEQHYRSF